jgi:hypothetical protein
MWRRFPEEGSAELKLEGQAGFNCMCRSDTMEVILGRGNSMKHVLEAREPLGAKGSSC